MAYSLGQLAERFACELQGDRDCLIRAVAPLDRAGDGEIAFLANPRFRDQLATSRAAAVIVSPRHRDECPRNALLTPRPYVIYARVAQLLNPDPVAAAGIHASAVVGPGAEIDATASVGPCAVIGAGARIGPACTIGSGCVIGEGATIGAASRLAPKVTVCAGVVIGQRARIQPGAVIGSEGFGYANDDGAWVRIPQIGRVLIGDDVDIGANTTIDRGAIEDTVLEEDVRLDNQVQVGHNVHIGAHTAMAGCVAVAGSAKIGRYCLIGGAAGIAGHLEICDRAVVTAMSFVTASITEPGEYSSGMPVQDARVWRRNAARFRQLDELARKIGARTKE